ncbi:MAG: thioredoxin domain-containing protein [Desulfurococcales archaeon]|nr:thioredoxin domain-containing protein [Desulfurococcales archaeon]
MAECRKPNRLIHEKSPYLRLHACNPVDWWPWSREALEEAKRLDKPLLISIGYSTCHWCHVMARESFSDPEVARVLNMVFINIKVDREERPDVDSYYMGYCQIASGSCGWPLTVIALPDGRPFYVATYLPREDLLSLAEAVEDMWRTRREDLESVAERAAATLEYTRQPRPGEPSWDHVGRAYERIAAAFDWEHGGVGVRPKFPTPHLYSFLLRYWRRTGIRAARDMVVLTLDTMLRRGIWDHVGWGLHRYSVDRYWHLPHFEKMLYDQAGLMLLLVEAWRATGRGRYLAYATRVAGFLLREMRGSHGGFYSAIDSESGGIEGLYYTYTMREVEEALGDDARLAARVFGLRREGNYRDEATGRLTGRNIISLAMGPEELAAEQGISVEEAQRIIDGMLERLRIYREQYKPRPSVDTKVLADWNAMAVRSMAELYRSTRDPTVLEAAKGAYRHIRERHMDGDTLLHSYMDGEAGIEGSLDDYAHTTMAAVALHQATQNPAYLRDALDLAEAVKRRLWIGGTLLQLPPGSDSPLAGAPAEAHDSSYPPGAPVMIQALAMLYKITGEPWLREVAWEALKRLWGHLEEAPAGYTSLLASAMLLLDPGEELVIALPGDGEDRLEAEVSRLFTPSLALVRITPSTREAITRLAPYTRSMIPVEGRPTYYLCRNRVCSLPVHDPSRVVEELSKAIPEPV